MKGNTITRQKIFVNKWKTSFIKFIGIRGLPDDTLELLLNDPNDFMQYSNEQVRNKIRNHNDNTIEINSKKK